MSPEMSSLQPIKLYGHQAAPNPWKIVIILKELSLPYEHIFVPFEDMKKEGFLRLSPNSRVPVIEDPNTGIHVWESGAIAEYLVETYDQGHKLTYTAVPEKWALRTWEHFQLTVQDLYCGQKAYFTLFHPNKNIPTVTEHFGKEVRRALAVIELHLSRTGQSYLVGEKCTFVDLMYIPFNVILSSVLLGERFEEEWRSELPLCYAWHRRLMERETVKDALRTKEKAMQEMSVPDLS